MRLMLVPSAVLALVTYTIEARAEVPNVVADIAPVHALVSKVMEGVGVPELLLPATVSPHDYALRPSDARSLQGADVVFWVGAALTPWLGETLVSLAPGARRMSMLEVEGTFLLEFREDSVFQTDSVADLHANGHDHSHDEDHDHSGTDPHAWLDPQNAGQWLEAIAQELSVIDPQNASKYQANAMAAASEIKDLAASIYTGLAPVREMQFVVLHDGYHYFENRFDLFALGAISESEAAAPSAARVSEIRTALEASQVGCVFLEAQISSPLLSAIAEEFEIPVRVLDPIGVGLSPGPELYSELLSGMLASFKSCL